MADFYHLDAINHQVTNEPIKEKDAIKAYFLEEFSKADMVFITEIIFEGGHWAILEWKDPKGLRGCGFFFVIDGKIKFQRDIGMNFCF